MKRWIATLCALMMVLLSMPSVTVAAADTFAYEMLGDNTVKITRYNGTETDLTIPAVIDGYTVAALGGSALAYSSVETVRFESGIALQSASLASPTLRQVTLPDGVTELADDLFHSCPKLETVEIPNGVTRIGASAFEGCSSLKEIVVPSSVTAIGSDAFCGCTSLESITLPDGLTEIGGGVLAQTAYYNKDNHWTDDLLCVNGYVLADRNQNRTALELPQGTRGIAYATFYRRLSLKTVTLPEGAVFIGGYAFYGCTALEKLSLPLSLRSIGAMAFTNCSSLYQVQYGGNRDCWEQVAIETGNDPLASTVTFASGFGYEFCGDGTVVITSYVGTETDLTIPAVIDGYTVSAMAGFALAYSSVETIRFESDITLQQAALGSQTLRQVTFLDGMTELADDLFHSCPKLESVEIPDGVTRIGASAFEGCSSLKEIVVPSSVTAIGSDAFCGCTSLVSLTLPDGLTEIGGGILAETAFYNDEANWTENALYVDGYLLTVRAADRDSFTVQEGTKGIADSAFIRRKSLRFVEIPSSVIGIGKWTFEDCSSLCRVTVSEQNPKYTAVDGVLFNKEMTVLHTYPDAKEGAGYTIPDSVHTVGESSFGDCVYLETVTIPSTVKTLERYAFSGCSVLERAVIEEGGVTVVSQNAFSHCRALSEVVLPEGLTEIAWNAFQFCSDLMSLTIPSSVTFIGRDAFEDTGFYSDESHWIDGVLYWGGHLIKADTSLSGAYAVKEGTKTIASDAFSRCKALQSVVMPDSVVAMGEWVFSYCSTLKRVVFSSGMSALPAHTFRECSALTELVLPSTLEKIGTQAFSSCRSLQTVELPATVTTIGDSAFYRCTSLETITLPVNVTTMGNRVFSGCIALESVTVPRQVTSIECGVFFSCASLRDVYFGGNAVEWDVMEVDGGNESLEQATVHCAVETVLGDVSGDGKRDMLDALQLYAATGGTKTLGKAQSILADCNGDGNVNTFDALRLYAIASGF